MLARTTLICTALAIASPARADRAEPIPATAGAPATMMAPPMPRQPPPPPPGPPPEVAALATKLGTLYTCKGVQFAGNGSSTPLVASLSIKVALDGAWLVASLAETKLGGIKVDQYRTYDPIAKQWTRVQLASTTAHVVSTSPGDRGGTWTWEGTQVSPQGTQQLRDYEQPGDRQLKLWGEALLGGGWQKTYEVTCKR